MALGLRRLTRNRYGRGLYERLGRAGITATRMYEYAAGVDEVRARSSPARIVHRAPGDDHPEDHADYAAVRPDEHVLAALLDGREVGHGFLSVDAAHRVEPLETTMRFEEGYLRRLWVTPSPWRR